MPLSFKARVAIARRHDAMKYQELSKHSAHRMSPSCSFCKYMTRYHIDLIQCNTKNEICSPYFLMLLSFPVRVEYHLDVPQRYTYNEGALCSPYDLVSHSVQYVSQYHSDGLKWESKKIFQKCHTLNLSHTCIDSLITFCLFLLLCLSISLSLSHSLICDRSHTHDGTSHRCLHS